MPIPPELRPDASGSIALSAQKGRRSFLPGVTTPTYGINGPFLGPAVRVRRGQKVVMRPTNALDEVTTMHWHGLKIPGYVDGSPYSLIKPGATWEAELAIDQPAATCWFHPHVYPATAEQVIKGLAGLFVIDDDEADGLGLPSAGGRTISRSSCRTAASIPTAPFSIASTWWRSRRAISATPCW